MRRINIFVLFLLCVFILTISAGAWADETEEEKEKGNFTVTAGTNSGDYEKFEDIITAANASNDVDIAVTINKGVTLADTGRINVCKKFTINLGGNTVSSSKRVFQIQSGDVTITGSGTIITDQGNEIYSVVIVGSKDERAGFASLTVDKGVKIASDNGGIGGIVLAGQNISKDNAYGQQLNFNGEVTVNAAANAIYNSKAEDVYNSTDINIQKDAIITVNNSSGKFAGIFHPNYGNITIEDGAQITGPTAIEIKAGNLTIKGGTFKANRDKPENDTGTASDLKNKNSTAGYAIVAVINNNCPGSVDIKIEDGKFDGFIGIVSDEPNAEKALYSHKITVTGGSFKSDDVKQFVDLNTYNVSQDGDWYVVKTKTAAPVATQRTVNASVRNNELSYDIKPAGSTATLEEILNKLGSYALSGIRKLDVNSQITELDNASLVKLSGLESLDLSNASGLSTSNPLNLSGVKARLVTMTSSTNVSNVQLSSTSDVKNLDARGATALRILTLAKNKNIKTIDITSTNIANLDASDCSGLTTLDAESGQLESLNLTGTYLTELKIARNKLTSLDLSEQIGLAKAKTSFKGQRSSKSFTRKRVFNLADVLGLSEVKSKIESVYAVSDSGEIQTGYYDSVDGSVMFDEIPEGALRYFYNTGAAFAGASAYEDDTGNANYMDVSLSNGEEAEEEEEINEDVTGQLYDGGSNTNKSSGGGCEVGSFGLGALMALMAFMKRKRV